MSFVTRSLSFGFSICLCALLLVGCGSAEGERSSDSEWTVEEGALALEEDLLVSDNEDFYFGDIRDVAIDDEGRIYVADGQEHHVKVLSPEGELLQTFGQEGNGPGEFEGLSDVTLARGDSLYAVDGYNDRVSVFAPDHAFAYSFHARTELGNPRFVVAPEKQSGFVLAYSGIPRPGGSEGGYMVHRMNASGTPEDTLLTGSPPEIHFEQNGSRITFFSIPFARTSHASVGPEEHIHYAWNDSLGVKTYGLEGELHRTIDVPFEPVPVTDEERRDALDGRSKRSRAAVQNEIPETKPAFDYFLVDDEGRYWFGRPTASSDSTAWWVADPDEKRVVTTTFPSKVRFFVVQDGFAYGETTTEQGAPALIRYCIGQAV